MKPGKRSRRKDDVFRSIRKPVAPPAKKLGDDKADERAYPAGRKVKHKKTDVNGSDE